MHLADKIAALVQKVGTSVRVVEKKFVFRFIPVETRHGWLTIEDKGDFWDVYLTSGKHSHIRIIHGNAYIINVRKDNGERKVGPLYLTGSWESAISMWPVYDAQKAVKVFDWVSSRIEIAYSHYVSSA